ncbi:EscU/YscU/HrcU family type III secretion system export apparatus switch protein [Paraburkholderia hayleyella]|uniref:EscU/YscU/HrcU family type III secretion system export apparatus switch protein n=1 Tax=Paraburkholderia hayleyella TaxID=2152889 RepID=UPI001290DE03|nr:EscU/YscU/HrcU family type III secretion system export apparatus switch protein [Paraburkholderia hayleyella]
MSNRTLQPTEKRKRTAKRDGDIAKSVMFSTAATQFLWLLAIHVLTTNVLSRMVQFINVITSQNLSGEFRPQVLFTLGHAIALIIQITGVVLLICLGAAILPELLQTRGAFAWKRLAPDPKRIDPVSGFQRIFGIDSLVDLIGMLLQLVFLSTVLSLMLKQYFGALSAMIELPVIAQSILIALVISSFLNWVVGLQLGLSLVDLMCRQRLWLRRLRMTHAEVQREQRDEDGDPYIKSERRSRHRQILK